MHTHFTNLHPADTCPQNPTLTHWPHSPRSDLKPANVLLKIDAADRRGFVAKVGVGLDLDPDSRILVGLSADIHTADIQPT